jgi:aspartate/methionine/tyrosine aminotransferase
MSVSRRIQAVQAPIIPVVAEWIRQTPGTISLGQGVVYYGPPPEAIEKLKAFLGQADNHKYKAVQGIPELLEGLAVKLRLENGIELTAGGEPRRVVVSAGGNMAFLNVLLAIADPGDEFILLRPAYFNHEMAVTMANCRAVMVDTDANYQPVLGGIQRAITPRTRAIVTVSPNNPTGAVYREADLRAINTLCRERRVYHIHDEAYEYFTYGVPHFSPCSIAGSESYTIGLFSFSKSYGLASWRVGYAVIPEHLFESVRKIQDTNLICPPVISQYAAVGALEVGRAYCLEKRQEIEAMRGMLRETLRGMSDLCTVPETAGAFYYLARIHTRMPAMTFAERLVREHRIAVIPGDAFGIQGGCHLRIGYGALPRDQAAEGFARLAAGIRALCSGESA